MKSFYAISYNNIDTRLIQKLDTTIQVNNNKLEDNK